MFILLKLFLAHLIADFVIQFDELYQLKLKHPAGHLLHVLTHALVNFLILFPYLGNPIIWIFVLLISTIHLIQDMVKYRLMQQHKQYFLHIFLGDQVLHFLFLSTILFFPVSSQKIGFAFWPTLDLLYTDNLWTVYTIALVMATFCGSFFLNALSITYLKHLRQDHFITSTEMTLGLIERSLVAGIFLWASNPVWFLISPLAGIFRFLFKSGRSKRDFMLSFIYAVLIGILFRFISLL